MHSYLTSALGLAAALSLLGPALAVAGEAVTYAGTITRIDLDRGAFMVEDVGPWMPGQPAPITPRTILLTPSTEIFQVRRAQDADSGFPGDYRKTEGTRSALVEGAFVSVDCAPAGNACRAVEITLVRPDSAA